MDDGGRRDAPDERWLLDHLPGSVFAIDDTGLIVAGSARAAALVGRPLDEFVGSSMLEYVDPDAVWAYAAAMNAAIDSTFEDTYGGPVRIAVSGLDGRKIAADLWSSNQLRAGGGALVLLLTEQTVALGIAEAVALAGEGAPYRDVATMAVGALGGFPVIADAAVFDATADGPVLVAGNVPRSLVDGTAGDEPWRQAIADGRRVLYPELQHLPPVIAELAGAAGYRAVWVEPVALGGATPTGALAVFRRLAGDPTSNELANVHHAASVLALATAARQSAG
jgi:hypothetical protein